jgi:hypothetical protein
MRKVSAHAQNDNRSVVAEIFAIGTYFPNMSRVYIYIYIYIYIFKMSQHCLHSSMIVYMNFLSRHTQTTSYFCRWTNSFGKLASFPCVNVGHNQNVQTLKNEDCVLEKVYEHLQTQYGRYLGQQDHTVRLQIGFLQMKVCTFFITPGCKV